MQIPYLDQIKPPASEPLTLSEAKLALRIDGSAEDAYIISLIKAARQCAEEYLRRSLITQEWQLQYDQYTPGIVYLPKGPIQEIIVAKVISQDWSETTIAPIDYYLNATKEKLIFAKTPIGMIIQIKYKSGYGDSDDVPLQLKEGMLAHIASMYENRDGNADLPRRTVDFYTPYKILPGGDRS